MAKFNPVFEKAGMKRVGDVVNPAHKELKRNTLTSASGLLRSLLCSGGDVKYRELVAPFAATHYINPTGD